MCIVASAMSAVPANAEWRQIPNNQIKIVDKISSGEAGKNVTINVYGIGKDVSDLTPNGNVLIYHDQTVTGANGSYEFVFTIAGDSGAYKAYINEDGTQSSETINFVKETKSTTGGGGGGGSASGSKKGNTSAGIVVTPSTKADEQPQKLNKDIFDDLDEASWAKEAIVNLAERRIVSGKTENTFCPNQNMTREEFAKIIADAFLPDAEIVKLPFSDTPEDAWYYNYVARAYSGGAINGKSDSLFGTGEYITREDMTVILYRILKDKFESDGTEHLFADSDDISEYAKEAVAVFYQNKIISGMEDNRFMPKGYATRAQVAKIVWGLVDIL